MLGSDLRNLDQGGELWGRR